MAAALEIIYWGSVASIGCAFAGYPVICLILGFIFRRPLRTSDDAPRPTLSFVLVLHNERDRVIRRLRNLLDGQTEPGDEILVICDGCTDETEEYARSLGSSQVRVHEVARGGKANALNRGVALANGEVVVFCDARQTFAPGAVHALLRHFSDPQTGAVSGNLEIEPSEAGAGRGVDLYWRLEKFVRRWEAAFDSTVGCTGAIYAIRRKLFEPLPEDTLLDDVVIPMRISTKGYRILFDPGAIAFEPQRLEPTRERSRKRRTLAGNYQILFRYPEWLLPWKSRLFLQLICHRYLRLAGAPLILLSIFSSTVLGLSDPLYRTLFVAEAALIILAVLGLMFPKLSVRLVTVPAGFLFLQLMTVEALVYYARFVRNQKQGSGVTW